MQIIFTHHRYLSLLWLALMFLLISSAAFAQSPAFTYQGKLTDNNNPASGNYDFEFKLFDMPALNTGTQQGATLPRLNVAVTNGIFTVALDFGTCASCFNGSPRYLEIAVKPASGSTFTTLGPRQPVSSTPYAIRSLNATTADGLSVACINCVTSSQIQSLQGSQINGVIPVAGVPAGNANYIQNTTSQQASSNFNISGTGSAGIFDAATQYNIAGSRILSITGSNNLFAGASAGLNNTTGLANSFFGSQAGQFNTTGLANSSFGERAGKFITTGSRNSFFGANTGSGTGTGNDNTFIGYFAVSQDGLNNTTAIGARAVVACDNCLVLGSINGINSATADTRVGIGTTTPTAKLQVRDADDAATADIAQFFAHNLTQGLGLGYNRIEAVGSNTDQHILLLPKGAGNLGIGATDPQAPLHLQRDGDLSNWQNAQLRISGATDPAMQLNLGYDTTNNRGVIQAGHSFVAFKDLLLNPFGGNVGIGISAPTFQLQLSSDSAAKPNGGSWSNPSDRRLKENIQPFTDGLAVLKQINPVSYRLNGKAGLPKGEPGIGVIAQEVREVLPYTITTFKAKLEAGDAEPSELLAFNSSALTFVLVNAVKELSARLDSLRAGDQQAEIDALKRENDAQKQSLAELERRLAAMEQAMRKLTEKP